MALEWQTAQQDYYYKKFKKHQDTNQWTTAIITTIWHGFLQLWESRNEDQHGRDTKEKQEKQQDILLRRTREIYESLERFEYEDKRYFTKDIHYWEQAPNHVIEEWLDIAEKIAKTYKNPTKQKETENQPAITRYFRKNQGNTTRVRQNETTYNKRPPRKPPPGE